jgi:hypothetical protein
LADHGEIKLNLGCELTSPAGWISIDGSWGAWLAKHPRWRRLLRRFRLFPEHVLTKPWADDVLVHDVRKRLPFADGVAAAVYSSHLLEHIHLEQAGFMEVAVRAVHDSRIADIEKVEWAVRVVKGAGICVEGIKPL